MSVGSRCPRRKLCGGVNPSNPPPRCREAAGIRFRGGDGLRPAGLMLRGLGIQYRALVSIETSSTATAVPLLLLRRRPLAASRGERVFLYPASEVSARCPTFAVSPTFRRVNTFPYEGKGDRLRWMRSAIAKSARHCKSSLNWSALLSFPLRGRGTSPRWMR